MRAKPWSVMVAAFVLGPGAAWATCPKHYSQNCVDFNLSPQVSQDIVGAEPLVKAAPKPSPTAEPSPAYTGPTIGINHQVRQAPEIGYRWAIN